MLDTWWPSISGSNNYARLLLFVPATKKNKYYDFCQFMSSSSILRPCFFPIWGQVKSSQFIHPNIHVYAQLNDIIHRQRSDQGKANNFQFHSILCILVHGSLRRVDWISSPWRGPLWPFGQFPLVIDVRFPPWDGFYSCPVGVARWICMREVWVGMAFIGRWFWVCRIFWIGVCGI